MTQQKNIVLPEGYKPLESEEYMCDLHLAFFKKKLMDWRIDLEKESEAAMKDLQANSAIEADLNDQASLEYEQSFELRTRDRARKLINKIDEAIDRIDSGDFGYCEETGDPIGLPRLIARPIATLCIEAKIRQEKKETGYAG